MSLIWALTLEQSSVQAKMMASILFKNTILNTTNEDDQHNIWFGIVEAIREQIKEGLFA